MGKNNKTSKSKFLKELEVLSIHESYVGSFKLKDKVALITGADSGIGRSVAVHFAREGASVVISYLKNDDDAENTKLMVEAEGQKCLLIKGDISSHSFCKQIVRRVSKQFSTIDILVNNAGMHVEQLELTGIDKKQLIRTFEVNIFSFFYLTQEILNIMPDGSSIINTSSVTAFRGSEHLIDYAATKAAIIAFTRSMSKNLVNRKIRVNAVAPGPIWTPLVIDSFSSEGLRGFGKDTLMGRAGYPYEVAPAYIYLASKDSSYVTGQVIHINGGDVVSG